MPLTSAQQPNGRSGRRPGSADPLSTRGRRRLALGVVALAMLPFGFVAACGNAATKQHSDTRPEPNASTEGVRSVYPSTAPPTPQSTAQEPRNNAGQSPGTGVGQ